MPSSDQNSSTADPPPAVLEEPPRVKLLCSFGGSILPRPLDGKLRYVGGETRIVTLPRDAGYEELAARMRELFDDGGAGGGGAADSSHSISASPSPAWVIKYQQPDEDLDALISVVNDDDVTNMMEEYDKLAAAPPTEGSFTRLRVFLFSQPDIDATDGSLHFDADDRETERRYVDALNSLPEGKTQSPDAAAGADPNRGSAAHFGGGGGGGEQYFVPASEVGLHGHQFNNLRRLTIPRLPSHGQLYSEVEGPWSPVATGYYSPGQGPHTPRDFPPSPSTSGRYHGGTSDLGDRFPDEYVRQSPAHHQVHQYDHLSSPFLDGNNNMVWVPPGGVIGEAAGGFPGNLAHVHPSGVYDGNAAATCEHCLMAFQRQQAAAADARYHDPRRNMGLHHPHYEHSDMGGAPFPGSCNECARQAHLYNQEMKFDNGAYASEQFEHPRTFYGDMHGHDRNWGLRQHPASYLPEDIRGYRNEQYSAEGGAVSSSIGHGSIYSESSVPSNYLGRDDSRYMRPGVEHGNGPYHDLRFSGVGMVPPPMHVPGMEDGGIRYNINPSAYGTDGLYHFPQGSSTSIHGGGRPVQGVPPTGPIYNISPAVMLQAPGATNLGYQPGAVESSAGYTHSNMDGRSQNPWTGQTPSASQKLFPIDGNINPDYHQDNTLRSNANILHQDSNSAVAAQPSLCQPAMGNSNVPKDLLSSEPLPACQIDNENLATPAAVDILEANLLGEVNEAMQQNTQGNLDVQPLNGKLGIHIGSTAPALVDQAEALVAPGNAEYAMENLTFLPELIASVQKAALEDAEGKEKKTVDASSDPSKKEQPLQDTELENAIKVLDAELDNDRPTMTKIEPTAAEMEALAKGLQVIRNDDLEEIRELGSGAYGSVFHGKWKGSDVAIKRIKGSCFSGKPTERERLISDFWKEALILSSLHHPNVVAFYGVVRDGPDGTLATVTEFMVNGSLKQFLQKKDRTIDRRKRLIIAMDAAFGMEYLHGKNIVHFDLKCENLLVNMRDPQRPVCKIGDLGLSKVKQKTLVSGGVRGTLPWMAPELLSGKSKMVTEKVDVYSFGIAMWELLTGEDPYTDMHCASIIGGIVNDTLRPQIPSWCDPGWKSLMESCWSSDPKERPSFAEISQRLRKMAAAINVK